MRNHSTLFSTFKLKSDYKPNIEGLQIRHSLGIFFSYGEVFFNVRPFSFWMLCISTCDFLSLFLWLLVWFMEFHKQYLLNDVLYSGPWDYKYHVTYLWYSLYGSDRVKRNVQIGSNWSYNLWSCWSRPKVRKMLTRKIFLLELTRIPFTKRPGGNIFIEHCGYRLASFLNRYLIYTHKTFFKSVFFTFLKHKVGQHQWYVLD